MARTIAVANQKGVDLDPQGNATSGVGVDKRDLENTVYELFVGRTTLDECLLETDFLNLSVLPANINLSGAEIDLIDMENREYHLKDILQQIKDDYDFILIDCPPSLNMLTVNAMTAADTVLVPIQCEYYALEGLSQLIHTINLVKKRLNPHLQLEGVVFTMYDARTKLSMQVVENVKQTLKENIYNTIIPRSIKLAEAPSYGMPITAYAPTSPGADAYRLLALEVIDHKV